MVVPCRSEQSPMHGNPNCDESIVAKLDEGKAGSGKEIIFCYLMLVKIQISFKCSFLGKRKLNKKSSHRSLKRRKRKQSGRNIPCAVQDGVTLSTKNDGILKQYGWKIISILIEIHNIKKYNFFLNHSFLTEWVKLLNGKMQHNSFGHKVESVITLSREHRKPNPHPVGSTI